MTLMFSEAYINIQWLILVSDSACNSNIDW